jgi:Cof subfamily protein (haloacid dehalogenase superfamily)
MIRLIFTDVDGTLVGSSSVVHPSVWLAADRARAAGIRLGICSGRPAFGVSRSYAERLDAEGWHIFQNGASVVHFATHRSLSSHLAPETSSMLIERARRLRRALELYTDDEYAIESTSDRARAHAALLGVPFAPRSFESLPPPIVRAQWLLARDEADAVLAEPHPGLEVSASTSPVMPDTLFANMTPAGVNKGTAVRAIAAEYGVALEDVMFVGDGWNDMVAMRLVGWPVAVANAESEARAIARHVVGHVDDGGLAEAIEIAMGET